MAGDHEALRAPVHHDLCRPDFINILFLTSGTIEVWSRLHKVFHIYYISTSPVFLIIVRTLLIN
jgi:hypothetical protein